MSSDAYAIARAALTQIPHGVTIIGAEHGDQRSCATGTCMYVSLAPAKLAIAEHPGSKTMRLIRESAKFSVSFLDVTQQDVAMSAGRSATGPDKFASLGIPMLEREGQAPAVKGSIAVIWCAVESTQPTGDHLLVIGNVVDHWVDPTKGDALLRYRRRYANIGRSTSDEAPEGYPV